MDDPQLAGHSACVASEQEMPFVELGMPCPELRPYSGKRPVGGHDALAGALRGLGAPDRAVAARSVAKPPPTDRHTRSCATRPTSSHALVPSACHCLSAAPRPPACWHFQRYRCRSESPALERRRTGSGSAAWSGSSARCRALGAAPGPRSAPTRQPSAGHLSARPRTSRCCRGRD